MLRYVNVSNVFIFFQFCSVSSINSYIFVLACFSKILLMFIFIADRPL